MHHVLHHVGRAALVLALGCAGVTDDDTDKSSLAGLVAARHGVLVADSGHWSTYAYSGFTRENFWVDLSVRNDDPNKQVGIVWTRDGWASSQTTFASYEQYLGGGREQWGVQVEDWTTRQQGTDVQIEYAAFATMNGTTSWSPFRNHFIYQPVSLERPVRLVESQVRFEEGRVLLEGRTRTLRTEDERLVFVRYTVDDWGSFEDVPAQPEGEEHAFSIELPIDPALHERVMFALRFESGDILAWDNGGSNYEHTLAPRPSVSSTNAPGEEPFDGLLRVNGNIETDLGVDAVALRVDGGAWGPLSLAEGPGAEPMRSGFRESGDFFFLLETRALGAGAHSFDVRVNAGPYERVLRDQPIRVAGAVENVGAVELPQVGGAPWVSSRGPDGALYIGYDEGAARLTEAEDGVEMVFEDAELSGIPDLAATETYLYEMRRNVLVRYSLETGAIDDGFGETGLLELDESTPLGAQPLCFASAFAADESGLYITDSCNARLLQLTLDGTFVREAPLLGDARWANVDTPVIDDAGRIWVVRTEFVGSPRAARYEAIAFELGRLSEVARVVIDTNGRSPDGLAITEGGFWASAGENLFRLDASGVQKGVWLGAGVYQYEVPGALSLAKTVEARDEGVVGVVSVQTERIELFRGR